MDFPTTQWSLLAEATLHGDEGAATALAEFCRRYRQPVVRFAQRRGFSPGDAEDVAQEFFLHVMEKSSLRRADMARGRFRSFLMGAVVRFIGDLRDRQQAQKRGGGIVALSLDDAAGENAATVPPAEADLFDREWALGLLGAVLEALHADFSKRGREHDYAVLRAYLPGGVGPLPYEESATRLKIGLSALKAEVHRLRNDFRERLRREIAMTVASPDEVETEIAYLGRVLQAEAVG